MVYWTPGHGTGVCQVLVYQGASIPCTGHSVPRCAQKEVHVTQVVGCSRVLAWWNGSVEGLWAVTVQTLLSAKLPPHLYLENWG